MTVRDEVIRTGACTADGKRVDVYRPGPGVGEVLPLVLLWHGTGCDERDVMRPLAEAVARRGLVVVVPDWRSDAPDRGRSHLLDSLDFALQYGASYGGDTDRTVLAGWSAGAPAACGIAFHPEAVGGWQPAAVVGIAGRYDVTARTTGTVPATDATEPGTPLVPVSLVHGAHDPVIDVSYSSDFAATLQEAGVPVRFEPLNTDHAGVIMAEYDVRSARCRPSYADGIIRHGRRVAGLIAGAAGLHDG